jgi:penicillin amidase
MRISSGFAFVLASLTSISILSGCGDEALLPRHGGGGGGGGALTSPLGNPPGLPIDARIALQNLSGPVDVVRDKNGRPHIYATSVSDAMRVEGFLVASDRHVQLDFYRRVSEGRLAELFSDLTPAVIDLDITYRHIGLARTAKAEYEALPSGPVKDALDAYADGVTQAFRQFRSGALHLPAGLAGIEPSALTDWSGIDSLAIGRLQTYLLSYNADVDLGNQAFFDAARGTFTATDPDPAVAKRAGLERDLFRFAPADPATTTTGYPMIPGHHTSPHGNAHVRAPAKPSALAKRSGPAGHAEHADALAAASGYIDAMRTMRRIFTRAGFGSNNWAIAGSRSATGHALVASDPHLSLSAPSVFWPVSIHVAVPPGGDSSQDLSVAGIAFPGIPAIILGHTDHLGWGATVAGYDVSDAYREQLTPDGKSVMFNGQAVALETVDEVINLQSGAPITYTVQIVPQHGPIVPTIVDHQVTPPDPTKGAISIRWTGLAATHELEAVFSLLRAKNVDDARTALKSFGVGGQNWMIGDTSGDILWTSHALVPMRDPRAFKWQAATYQGTLPCFVLPGDGTAEWTGFLNDDLVPWEKDPAQGYISTANNDPIGDTLDNDPSNDTLPDKTPMYLACTYDIGFREGKIHKRIEAHAAPFALTDLSAIQGDEQSSMGTGLTPSLVTALEHAQAEKQTPGTHPDLTSVVADPAYDTAKIATVHDALAAWSAAGFPASSGVNPDDNTPLPASGSDGRRGRRCASDVDLQCLADPPLRPRLRRRARQDEGRLLRLAAGVARHPQPGPGGPEDPRDVRPGDRRLEPVGRPQHADGGRESRRAHGARDARRARRPRHGGRQRPHDVPLGGSPHHPLRAPDPALAHARDPAVDRPSVRSERLPAPRRLLQHRRRRLQLRRHRRTARLHLRRRPDAALRGRPRSGGAARLQRAPGRRRLEPEEPPLRRRRRALAAEPGSPGALLACRGGRREGK